MENTDITQPTPPAAAADIAPAPAPPVQPEVPSPAPASSDNSPRGLSLWELMRKDTPATTSDNDDTDRVLANPRPSIWDLD